MLPWKSITLKVRRPGVLIVLAGVRSKTVARCGSVV
jgi:hypothetical protein